jgi:hypothetical protein
MRHLNRRGGAPVRFIHLAEVFMQQSQSAHPGMAFGGVFLALFGATWLVGASVLYLSASALALAAIAAGAVGLVAWALATFRARRLAYAGAPDPAAGRRLRRALIGVNAAQWSLIGLAILVMNVSGHIAWIMPSVIFLVGVHFFPLARIFGYRGYYWTAAGLVLVAVLDVAAGAGGALAAPSLLATGAILWLSAAALLRALQPAPAEGGVPVGLS